MTSVFGYCIFSHRFVPDRSQWFLFSEKGKFKCAFCRMGIKALVALCSVLQCCPAPKRAFSKPRNGTAGKIPQGWCRLINLTLYLIIIETWPGCFLQVTENYHDLVND